MRFSQTKITIESYRERVIETERVACPKCGFSKYDESATEFSRELKTGSTPLFASSIETAKKENEHES